MLTCLNSIRSKINQINDSTFHIAIALSIYIIFKCFLPPIGVITRQGMDVLGVFIFTLYLWTNCSISWPSFMGIGLIGLSGIVTWDEVIKLSWGNWLTPFICSCLIINFAMKETGFSRRVALWFVTRDWVRGKPWFIVTMFLFSCMFLGLFMSSTPTTVLFMSLAEQILDNTGHKRGEKLCSMLMSCVAWIATATMGMTPISHVLVIMVIGLIGSDFGISINMLSFTLVGLSVGILFFLCLLLVCKFIIKPDLTKLKDLDIDAIKRSIPSASKEEKIVGMIFGSLVLVWICPDILSCFKLTASLGAAVSQIGQTVPAIIAVGLLCIIQVNEKPIISLENACREISWGSVFMMAQLMLLGNVVSSEAAGISQTLSSIIAPITKNMSPFLFVLTILLFIIVLTNFINNTTCALFYTIVAPIAANIDGLNVIALSLMIGIIANYGLATPAATTTTNIVVSSGWVSGSFLWKYGWYLVIITLLASVFIGYPLAAVLFPNNL